LLHPLLGMGGPLSTGVITMEPPVPDILPPAFELPPFAPLSLPITAPPPNPVVVDPEVPVESPPAPGFVLSPPAPVGSVVVSSSSWGVSPFPALQPASERKKTEPRIKKERMENLIVWFSQGARLGAFDLIHSSVWRYPSLR
jgi:hypothetical protein